MQKWMLLIGAVLGLITVVLLNVYVGNIESREKGMSVLKLQPGVSLSQGDQITDKMLTTIQLPERFSSMTEIVIADNQNSRAWITGRMVTKDITGGSLLLHEHFADAPGERFAARISEGKRAVSIGVDRATAVAYFIEPGSRVDVLGTFEQEETQEVRIPAQTGSTPQALSMPNLQRSITTKTILQNVRVLAVGHAASRGNYLELNKKGFATVTIEVSPEEVEKLAFALGQVRGGLLLALRNPDDGKVVKLPSVSWDALNK